MADLKPPPQKTVRKVPSIAVKNVSPKPPKAPLEQIPPNSSKPIQFMVSESIKIEFKSHSVQKGSSMNALFLTMWDEYKSKHCIT